MNAEVQFEVGGDLVFEAPQGRASAATCALYHDGTLIDSPAVTIDTATTTLTAGASPGASTLALTSATGFAAGRRYLIANAKNEAEWVYVKAVSSLTLTLHAPIAYTYLSGDAIVGTRLTVTVTAAAAATLAEGDEARWTYTVGTVRKVVQQYDVLRQPWPAVGEIVTPWRYAEYAGAGADDELEGKIGAGLDFAGELREADAALRRDLLARGRRASLFRDPMDFEIAIMERALLESARQGANVPAVWQDQPEAWLEHRERRYSSVLTDALSTARSFDADESGVVTGTEKAASLGTMRLTR